MTEDLKIGIRSSTKSCCCLSCDQLIFGRLDQAKYILMETFDGKHISIDGPDGNKIDCMFFPCTSKEEVLVDESATLDGRPVSKDRRSTSHASNGQNESSVNRSTYSGADVQPLTYHSSSGVQGSLTLNDPKYLSMPTIIMCNPNALYYQQMVTSPNAYWLNFFLKRDINVICWNYRGYGESTRGFMETLSPYKSKRDVEYVMAYLVNKLKVKGKIGVYGRSIGGLTACHLANKYNNLIKCLIVDRSFYELSSVPEGKLKGKMTSRIFDLISWKWRTRNHSNFATTTNCYKIITCDPLDDTIDLFGNLSSGVASQLALTEYETDEFRQFYETLLFIFEFENRLYEQLSDADKEQINTQVIRTVADAETDQADYDADIAEIY